MLKFLIQQKPCLYLNLLMISGIFQLQHNKQQLAEKNSKINFVFCSSKFFNVLVDKQNKDNKNLYLSLYFIEQKSRIKIAFKLRKNLWAVHFPWLQIVFFLNKFNSTLKGLSLGKV